MIKLIYSLPSDPVVQAAKGPGLEAIQLVCIRELYQEFLQTGELRSLEKGLIIDRCGDGWDSSASEGLLDFDVGFKELNAFFAAYFCQIHGSERVIATLFHIGTPWNPNRLPAQWALIQNHRLPLQTPEYFEGEASDLAGTSDLVFSHPNKLYNWKAQEREPDESQVFCFRRPAGEALILAKTFDQWLLMKADGEPLTEREQQDLMPMRKRLETIFHFSSGEILIFSHAGEYTFGMFSNYPLIAGRYALFQGQLRIQLQRLVERELQ